MSNIPEHIKKKAHSLCIEYIGGIWQSVSINDIIFTKFSGGYVNLTFKISLPEVCKPAKNEPVEAVMKLDLGLYNPGIERRLSDSIIAVLLAEKNISPRVYGVFEDGRLDEYIPTNPLTGKDLNNSLIVTALMKRLAQIHSLNLPLKKQPALHNQCIEYTNKIINKIENKELKRDRAVDLLMFLNPTEELKWLKKALDSLNSIIVYSHGDLQYNNLLYYKDHLYLIDYDLSGYNYQAIDLASFMMSHCYTVPYPEPPYILFDWTKYPSEEKQKCLFRIYLEDYKKINNMTFNIEDEAIRLIKEAKVVTLLILYLFALHALNQDVNNLDINHVDWTYVAYTFLTRYKQVKEDILLVY